MSVADVALSRVRQEAVRSAGYCNNQAGDSILVYLSVAGSVIPMRVLESDPIASVKLRIQTCKGFVVKKQKLVFGGRELARNDSLVKDYGIKAGNVLHLVLKLSDLLLITVRTTGGKEFELHVDRNRNVGYLKQRIARKDRGFVDVDEQEIFCNGEKVADQRLIDDLCKNNDAVIHLVVQKSAKVRAKPVEKDLELSVVAESDLDERRGSVGGEKNKLKGLEVVKKEPIVRDFWLEPVIVNPKVKLPFFMWDMIHSTFEGLQTGNQPIRSSEGTGGTYLMQDKLGFDYVSIFKPIDEEPMAVNNPQGLPLSTNGEDGSSEDGENLQAWDPGSLLLYQTTGISSGDVPNQTNRSTIQASQPASTSNAPVLRKSLSILSEMERAQRKRKIDQAYRERRKNHNAKMQLDLDNLTEENAHLKMENQSLKDDNASMNQTLRDQEKEINLLRSNLLQLKCEHEKQNVLLQTLSGLLADPVRVENEKLKDENASLRKNANLYGNLAQLAAENAKLKIENKVLKVQNDALCGKIISDNDRKREQEP